MPAAPRPATRGAPTAPGCAPCATGATASACPARPDAPPMSPSSWPRPRPWPQRQHPDPAPRRYPLSARRRRLPGAQRRGRGRRNHGRDHPACRRDRRHAPPGNTPPPRRSCAGSSNRLRGGVPKGLRIVVAILPRTPRGVKSDRLLDRPMIPGGDLHQQNRHQDRLGIDPPVRRQLRLVGSSNHRLDPALPVPHPSIMRADVPDVFKAMQPGHQDRIRQSEPAAYRRNSGGARLA